MPSMRGLYLVALLQSPLAATAAFCPPLGPVFPSPKSLSTNAPFQKDLEKLETSLKDAFANGNTSFGAVNPNDTYSVQIFSTKDARPLLDFHHRGAGVEESKGVNGDSIYGIASTTKLITVYLLLLKAGDGIFNDHVTKYLPELSGKGHWDEITVGTLAGYMGGTVSDAYNIEKISAGGLGAALPGAFPPLSPEEIPPCGYGTAGCTREVFLQHVATRGQVNLPNTTPGYSNVAFATLGLVLESITGVPYADGLRELLNDPLNLNATTSSAPSNTSRVIEGSDPVAAWNTSIGGAGIGMGAMFSSANDMASIGRAILSSSMLPANTTRAWLKPTSHTSSLIGAVGRPWEIFRATLGPAQNNRVVDLYTKAGNGFGYGANFVLIPDFDIGFIVLMAGDRGRVPLELSATIVDQLLPALEEAARVESNTMFAGTYNAVDGLNSSLEITTTTGIPGLTIERWISNGTDMPISIYGSPKVQMYPTNIMSDGTKYSWRSSSIPFEEVGPFSACGSWFILDRPTYGVYGIDKFEFHVDESGKATAVELEALKIKLHRE